MSERFVVVDVARQLNQEEIWIDREGVTHRLVDMPPSYRANVLGFLRRNAQRLQNITAWRILSTFPADGDMSDGVASAFDACMSEMHRPHEAWIEDQPLVRALREMRTTPSWRLKIHNRVWRLLHPNWTPNR